MRITLWIILLLPSFVWASAAQDLLNRLENLNNLSGDFEQLVLDEGGTRMQEASGSMQVARGNRFYWHTMMPFEQLAVSDGETVWVHDVDLEQVVQRPLTRDLSKTPALLFGGNPDQVSQAFDISERNRGEETVTFRLLPTGNDPLFETLDVTFNGDLPVSMRLEDALGQKTVIDFRDLTLNGPLDAEKFAFQVPEGADLIRQE